MTIIVGAGIAGLMAANIFQRAHVFESGNAAQSNHKAVLRFRSSAVGDAVGIDFRKVIVHKGLWHEGKFVSPNIQLANLYSKKVIGRLADRSVWNLDPVERFIAPEDFIHQLADRCRDRIDWEHPVNNFERKDAIITTIPMNISMKMLPDAVPQDLVSPEFNYAPIAVRRWHVPKADVFQTIYFSEPATSLYRASITGDLLIAEYIGDSKSKQGAADDATDDYDFFPAFGLNKADCRAHDTTKQRYGKISPIDERWRRAFILNASLKHKVFSLGRFAVWKNILADHVLHDIYVVKRLMQGDDYGASRHSVGT